MRTVFGAVLAGAMAVSALPVLAQDGPVRARTIVVYGDDPCPVASNPDEIIVCARRPEEERYRIPKELRELEAQQVPRRDDVGAERAALASGRPSATGIGSCSTVGPGGMTGCTPGVDVVGVGRTIVRGVETATEPTDD
ncbi:MAG: hypothetical protein ACK4MX_03315 [Thermaurantiacus sp.]